MGEEMSDTQAEVRQAIREAITRFRSGETSLSDLIGALDPVIDEVQPEEVWEPVSELFNELDAFYGLNVTGGEAADAGVLSKEQRQNANRIVTAIGELIA